MKQGCADVHNALRGCYPPRCIPKIHSYVMLTEKNHTTMVLPSLSISQQGVEGVGGLMLDAATNLQARAVEVCTAAFGQDLPRSRVDLKMILFLDQ